MGIYLSSSHRCLIDDNCLGDKSECIQGVCVHNNLWDIQYKNGNEFRAFKQMLHSNDLTNIAYILVGISMITMIMASSCCVCFARKKNIQLDEVGGENQIKIKYIE